MDDASRRPKRRLVTRQQPAAGDGIERTGRGRRRAEGFWHGDVCSERWWRHVLHLHVRDRARQPDTSHPLCRGRDLDIEEVSLKSEAASARSKGWHAEGRFARELVPAEP
jgi:hypothetical protein